MTGPPILDPADCPDPAAGLAAAAADTSSADAPGGSRPSQATLLVELAQTRYRLGMSDRGDAFGTPHGGPNIARMLRGDRDSLRAELAAAFAADHGKAPSSQALADALLVLEGRAQACDREPVGLRVARHGRGVVVDLGTPDGQAVVVTADGWEVTDSPVLFRRTALTDPLPVPETGTLDDLWRLVNVAPGDRPLIAAWLVMTLLPGRPCPILLLTGEHGSAKTAAGKMIAALVDSGDAMRAPPRELEGWIVAADASHVVGLDNLSRIPEWLSDAMCRTVTGEALVRRKLYTDSAVSRVSFRRPVIVTAIDPGALRGDLADRLLAVELDRIAEDRRLTDDDVASAWHQAHPRVLGALLDLAASVFSALPSVELVRLPRMADYARVLAAVDKVLGSGGLGAYLGQRARVAADVVDADPVAAAVRDHVATVRRWEGTATELLDAITGDRERLPKGWPASGQTMAAQIKRHAPGLRACGIAVDYDPTARPRRWRLSSEGGPYRGDASDGGTVKAADQQKRLSLARHSSVTPSLASDGGPTSDGPETGSDLRLDTSVTSDTSKRPIFPDVDPAGNGEVPDDPLAFLADWNAGARRRAAEAEGGAS